MTLDATHVMEPQSVLFGRAWGALCLGPGPGDVMILSASATRTRLMRRTLESRRTRLPFPQFSLIQGSVCSAPMFSSSPVAGPSSTWKTDVDYHAVCRFSPWA